MSSSFHSHKKSVKAIVHRDPVASRKHGEYTDDVGRACTIWLMENCPGYRTEYEYMRNRHALKFGKGT